MYYVYVILNEKGDNYIGYSQDIENRLKQHNRGENVSTRGHVWRLVYSEAFLSKIDAKNRERKIKQRGQAKRHLFERIKHSMENPV